MRSSCCYVGITYQIGNMISSPSAQIVNAIAENTFIRLRNGDNAPAYGPTMGVATAIIAVGIAVTTAFGPEKRGRQLELARVAGAAVEDEPRDIEEGSMDEKRSVKGDHIEVSERK